MAMELDKTKGRGRQLQRQPFNLKDWRKSLQAWVDRKDEREQALARCRTLKSKGAELLGLYKDFLKPADPSAKPVDRAQVQAWLKEIDDIDEELHKIETFMLGEQEEFEALREATAVKLTCSPKEAQQILGTLEDSEKVLDTVTSSLGGAIQEMEEVAYSLPQELKDDEEAEKALDAREAKAQAKAEKDEKDGFARLYKDSMDWVQKALWHIFGSAAAVAYGNFWSFLGPFNSKGLRNVAYALPSLWAFGRLFPSVLSLVSLASPLLARFMGAAEAEAKAKAERPYLERVRGWVKAHAGALGAALAFASVAAFLLVVRYLLGIQRARDLEAFGEALKA